MSDSVTAFLLERWHDDRRPFEDEPFRRAACFVDDRAFEEGSCGRTNAPAKTVKPATRVQIREKARNIGRVQNRNDDVAPAGAREGFTGFFIAQPAACRSALDARH